MVCGNVTKTNYNAHRVILTPFSDDCGQMSKIVIWLKLVILLKIVLYTLKLHLHGRLLSARIEILPFFFFKSRRSLTRRKIHKRYCLRGIVTHAQKKSNRSSHSHGKDFNATLARGETRCETHTSRDSLAAIAFGKNSRRVSNTSDLRCQSCFARLHARIVLARDHFTRDRFQRLESPRAKSRSCKQQIVCNLRVPSAVRYAQMLCESLAAIILNLLHKILCS